MSKLQFQAKVSLDSAVVSGDGWEVGISFRDGEGVFQGRDLQVGDVIIFNTAIVEPGTYTRYTIEEVVEVDWLGGITLLIKYQPSNDNTTPNPPLDYLVGSDGVVSRPSPNRGLLPVISPRVQGMVDAYSFYTLNHNLVKLLDQDTNEGGNARPTQLVTAEWLPVDPSGRAPLPSEPLGDFVWGIGFAFLMDGSLVELMGVKPVLDEESGTWYAVIPSSDVAELDGQIGALTVTYLTPNESS